MSRNRHMTGLPEARPTNRVTPEGPNDAAVSFSDSDAISSVIRSGRCVGGPVVRSDRPPPVSLWMCGERPTMTSRDAADGKDVFGSELSHLLEIEQQLRAENEHLREAQRTWQDALQQYAELFDASPVPSVAIDRV